MIPVTWRLFVVLLRGQASMGRPAGGNAPPLNAFALVASLPAAARRLGACFRRLAARGAFGFREASFRRDDSSYRQAASALDNLRSDRDGFKLVPGPRQTARLHRRMRLAVRCYLQRQRELRDDDVSFQISQLRTGLEARIEAHADPPALVAISHSSL